MSVLLGGSAHPVEEAVLVDEVVLERGADVAEDHGDEKQVEALVHQRQQFARSSSPPGRSGIGSTPNQTVWKPLAELISQPVSGIAIIST